MKKILSAVGITTLILTSCQTNTQSGALGGAAVGALAGGLIGGNIEGAVIGGAIGTVAGGLVGYALDQQQRETLQQNSPGTLNRIDRGEALSVDDVVQMHKNGLQDDVIINQIRATNTHFYLSSNDIVYLKKNDVSEDLINYMISTGQQ